MDLRLLFDRSPLLAGTCGLLLPTISCAEPLVPAGEKGAGAVDELESDDERRDGGLISKCGEPVGGLGGGSSAWLRGGGDDWGSAGRGGGEEKF